MTTLTMVAGCAAVTALALAASRAGRGRGAAVPGEGRVLFVGESPAARALAHEIECRADGPWRVVGLVVDRTRDAAIGIGPWLGPIAALPGIIASTGPTDIVVAPAEGRRGVAEQVLFDAHLAGLRVETAGEASEHVTGKMPIEELTARGLLRGGGFRHADTTVSDLTHQLARFLSAVAAGGGLLLGAPLFGLLALAIRLDSPGPALFVQERIGMGGRPFRLYKFRTMHETARRASEWVSDNADRITRVGRWLRRFRLDELPQLVNVVRGDMNLVGPRPHPSCNAPLFLARIPHYRLRFSVRPGITGWAQIRYGYANGLDEETEKMRYDLYYIKHRSMRLDLRILALTARTLIFDAQNHEAAGGRTSMAWWQAHGTRSAWR